MLGKWTGKLLEIAGGRFICVDEAKGDQVARIGLGIHNFRKCGLKIDASFKLLGQE